MPSIEAWKTGKIGMRTFSQGRRFGLRNPANNRPLIRRNGNVIARGAGNTNTSTSRDSSGNNTNTDTIGDSSGNNTNTDTIGDSSGNNTNTDTIVDSSGGNTGDGATDTTARARPKYSIAQKETHIYTFAFGMPDITAETTAADIQLSSAVSIVSARQLKHSDQATIKRVFAQLVNSQSNDRLTAQQKDKIIKLANSPNVLLAADAKTINPDTLTITAVYNKEGEALSLPFLGETNNLVDVAGLATTTYSSLMSVPGISVLVTDDIGLQSRVFVRGNSGAAMLSSANMNDVEKLIDDLNLARIEKLRDSRPGTLFEDAAAGGLALFMGDGTFIDNITLETVRSLTPENETRVKQAMLNAYKSGKFLDVHNPSTTLNDTSIIKTNLEIRKPKEPLYEFTYSPGFTFNQSARDFIGDSGVDIGTLGNTAESISNFSNSLLNQKFDRLIAFDNTPEFTIKQEDDNQRITYEASMFGGVIDDTTPLSQINMDAKSSESQLGIFSMDGKESNYVLDNQDNQANYRSGLLSGLFVNSNIEFVEVENTDGLTAVSKFRTEMGQSTIIPIQPTKEEIDNGEFSKPLSLGNSLIIDSNFIHNQSNIRGIEFSDRTGDNAVNEFFARHSIAVAGTQGDTNLAAAVRSNIYIKLEPTTFDTTFDGDSREIFAGDASARSWRADVSYQF